MSGVELSSLRRIGISEVNESARRETRRREAALPPIATFRWWARRTEAVNGGVLDAYAQDHGGDLLVVDPFAGGGVIPLVALARGHSVYAQDIDPWAVAGIHTMLTLPDPAALDELASRVREVVSGELAKAYSTKLEDGTAAVVSHTLRVLIAPCARCGMSGRRFPHALVTRIVRREQPGHDAWLACRAGHLFRALHTAVTHCPTCRLRVDPLDRYTEGRQYECTSCGHRTSLSEVTPDHSWQVALVDRVTAERREIGEPTPGEQDQADDTGWSVGMDLGPIPEGQETAVLLRHGFSRWQDIYPSRQLVITQTLLEAVERVGDEFSPDAVRCLRFAILGTAEMAGFLSRWDRWYLKSYEAMARHRYSVTSLAAEPNVWGAYIRGRGTVVRRLMTLKRGATWLTERGVTRSTVEQPITATARRSKVGRGMRARVVLGSSQRLCLPSESVDLVLTDPPYHDDLHYSELSIPFRAWAGLDTAIERGLVPVYWKGEPDRSYADLLSEVFAECRRVLRPKGHLILSFANKDPRAWIALLSALEGSGFRGLGYHVVHGENETDHAKSGNGNYSRNLLLDVVRSDVASIRRWRPKLATGDPEVDFLSAAGEIALQVGELPARWRERLVESMQQSAFLNAAR